MAENNVIELENQLRRITLERDVAVRELAEMNRALAVLVAADFLDLEEFNEALRFIRGRE